MKYRYIAIEGNIGSGKTTLAKKLAEKLNGSLILEEFADNPYLPKFYTEPDKHSFPLELSFLAARFHQLKEVMPGTDLFQPISIADYALFKCLVFARINLTEDEFELYKTFYTITSGRLPKPDLVIYLYQPLDNLALNIKTRGRDYEQRISPEYLHKIHQGYMSIFQQAGEQKIVYVDCSEFNHINEFENLDQLLKIIESDYELGINVVSL